MNTYIEINDTRYPAIITGRLADADWGNRASKAITIELSYVEALELFVDNIAWFIVQEDERQEAIEDEAGNISYETVTTVDRYDNSDYNIAGDIIDHRNGTITVKMGKPTAEELLALFEEGLSL